MPRGHRTPRRTTTLLSLIAITALASVAIAEDEPQSVTLQWFEADWNTIENRMPDFFVAGYSSTWLPPITTTNSEDSPGYDPLDMFDIGEPGDETFYGTFRDFRAMVDEFHRANAEVYVDTILNHNGARTGNQFFYEAGGWPGFSANWTGGTKSVGGDWGDFNDGTTQSESPGSPNYDLWRGDLVGLQDRKLDSNYWMVRHPLDDSLPEGVQSSAFDPPVRIREGTFRNIPTPENAGLYPDQALAPKAVMNPGIFRSATEGFPSFNTPAETVTVYPFNVTPGETLDSAVDGDPVMENCAAVLSRWSQWALEVLKIDGFRLDAMKHMEPWYFDRFFDVAVHDRRTLPDGSTGTPFSFGESTASNNFILNYYARKDGFGNRDALDLSGAGTIRNIINARGLGNCSDLDNDNIDVADDGFNNGSFGMLHTYSHDNGSRGDGGSSPGFPFEDKMAPWAHAYLLLRTGRAIVYHNAKAQIPNVARFWPREGIPTALGYGTFNIVGGAEVTVEDDRYTRLVQLRKRYGRGFYIPRFESADVLVFERQGNMLVGVTDRYDTGIQTVAVNTDFPQGTVLVEVSGNAGDPIVDPSNALYATRTVGAGGSVTIRIPHNTSSVREHSTGYVVYAPQTPDGTLSVPDADDTILADTASVPSAFRRLTPMDVVRNSTFTLSLVTEPNDFDSAHDDNALFRINQGYADYNDDGMTSRDEVGAGEFEQYERFIDVNQPLFGTANANGLYSQTIDTDLLPEGRNYVSAVAFRHRTTGDPLLTDFRKVIYVDRHQPDAAVDVTTNCAFSSLSVRVTNTDRTVTDVQVFPGVASGAPLPAPVQSNVASSFDRGVWTWSLSGVTEPSLDIAVAAIEDPGNLQSGMSEVNRTVEYLTVVTGVKGDVNLNGAIDVEDLYEQQQSVSYECRADTDDNMVIDATDGTLFAAQLRTGELTDMVDR